MMAENTSNRNSLYAIMSVLLTGAGAALLGWSLFLLPEWPAYGFPWAFAGTVAAFVLISAGGWCLNAILRGRRGAAVGCGHDGNGTGGGITFGLFVIIAGVLLLSFNSGALPAIWKPVFFSWQMLLITIGAMELGRGRFWGGGICLAVGAFFIVRRLEHVYPDIAASGIGFAFWPVLLIILGVLILGGIIFRPRRRQHRSREWRGERMRFGERPKASGASGYVEINTVFGSSEQVYLDPVFQGGQISTVFGGVSLDLRRTELPEGDTWLNIEAIFGGVEIFAPAGWHIELRNDSVFGGFTDKRRFTDDKTYADGRRLIIKASNVLGGGELKS